MTYEQITTEAYSAQRACMATLGSEVPAYAALSAEEKAMFVKLATWMCSGDNATRRRSVLADPAEQAFAEVVIALRGLIDESADGARPA